MQLQTDHLLLREFTPDDWSAYLLYWAVSGWYGESSGEEAKLAFATLLGILAFPLGAFVRRWAYHGFTKALGGATEGAGPY